MAARRTERLVNLVFCLLHTRSFLTAERIRELVEGYADAPSEDAFKRMFERDKEDLRDLGIPLETGQGPYDEELGYRIVRSEYELPPISLEPDEAMAVGLAARMWSSAALGSAATRALRKLEATGVSINPLPDGLQPRVDTSAASLPELSDAVRRGRQVSFDYRGAADAAATRRNVEPWGVVSWHGRWYLAGLDTDRDAPRVFRLSRVSSTPVASGREGVVQVPDGLDLTAMVSSFDPPPSGATAQVRVRRGRAHGLRRRALDVADAADGWELLTLACPDPDRLVQDVLPYGADAVILAPAAARSAIVDKLRTMSTPDPA